MQQLKIKDLWKNVEFERPQEYKQSLLEDTKESEERAS